MNRVCVIGCPGSGKSTFARALRDRTGLPLYHLDMIYHRPDRTTVSREVFDHALMEILALPQFIIDGNYARTLPVRLARCDTVFFLDYPTEVCLDGIHARLGQPHDDLPWVETEPDAEFVEFVQNFRRDTRPEILRQLASFPALRVVTLHAREEAPAFLNGLRV